MYSEDSSKNKERKVHWDLQTTVEPILSQFAAYRQTKPSFNKIKTNIIKYLRNKEYSHLHTWLSDALPDNGSLKAFFSEQGDFILKYSLAYFEDIKALEFIKEHFPISDIKISLRKKRFTVLDEFFTALAGAELFKKDSMDHRIIRMEKFKFLLNIDPETIREFIDQNLDQKCLTDKIKEDFFNVEAEFKQGCRSACDLRT
jgi:hypothetical protein